MLRLNRLRTTVVPLAAMAAMAFADGNAAAKDTPFKISGGGIAPTGLPLPGQAPRIHPSTGNATHLGKYSGTGAVQTDSAAFDPNIGPAGGFAGEFGSGTAYTFTAANGDKLVTWYGRIDHGAATPGTFELTILGPGDGGLGITVQAAWIAEFVIDGAASTGRFAGASGSWIMYAYSQPFVLGTDDPVHYTWEGEGRISLK
jgi:hypothetical protein